MPLYFLFSLPFVLPIIGPHTPFCSEKVSNLWTVCLELYLFLWKAFFSRFTFKQLNTDLGVCLFFVVYLASCGLLYCPLSTLVNSCGQRPCVTLKYTAVLMFIESIYWIPYRKPIIVFKMYFKYVYGSLLQKNTNDRLRRRKASNKTWTVQVLGIIVVKLYSRKMFK